MIARNDQYVSDGALLTAALGYAERGLLVFPCWWIKADGLCACGNADCTPWNAGKHPIGAVAPNGYKNATKDPATIREWWSRYPAANVAIRTGAESGLDVIDLDVPDLERSPPKLQDGRVTWAAMEREQPSDAAVRAPSVESGTEGRHLWFTHREGVPSRSGVFPGIDLRGDDGYILVPPSQNARGAYRWVTPLDAAEPLPLWPDWLAAKVDAALAARMRAKTAGPTASGGSELDVVERAIRYLHRAPPAVSGENGSARCFSAAMTCVEGFGLSDADAYTVLSGDWNARCQPPWSEKELRHKIEDARKKVNPAELNRLRHAGREANLAPARGAAVAERTWLPPVEYRRQRDERLAAELGEGEQHPGEAPAAGVPQSPSAHPVAHDREAEVALLACLLKDPVASEAGCAAAGGISTPDFYDSGTRQVRQAVLAVQARGGRPDAVTLRLELEGKHAAGTLAEVLAALPAVAAGNAEILARRVRACSEARADRALLDEIRRHLESGAPTASAAIEAACARRREEFASAASLSSAWGWRTPEELAASPEAQTDWIVPNMIARQHVTVVYAKPKVGKTDTVVAGILAPLSRGEGVFGYPAPATPVLAVILSEETTGRWKSHVEKFGLRGGRILTRGKVPSGVTFAQAVEEAARFAASIGAAVVVIDTLTAHAGLAGDAENDAGKMGEALDPVLRAAAAHNVAFVLIHHVRKWTKDADPADVDLLRGSGNFAAKVDFLVHVTKPSDAPGRFRRRELHVTGRLDCEPYSLLIEKVPGAPDRYRVLNASDAEDDPALKDAILEALAGEPMIVADLVKETERRKADVLVQLKSLLTTGAIRCLKKGERPKGTRGKMYALPGFALVGDTPPGAGTPPGTANRSGVPNRSGNDSSGGAESFPRGAP